MIFEIPKEDILKGLINQLTSFFSISNSEINTINSLAETVFKRCEFSFLKNKNKYYSKDSVGYFNPSFFVGDDSFVQVLVQVAI